MCKTQASGQHSKTYSMYYTCNIVQNYFEYWINPDKGPRSSSIFLQALRLHECVLADTYCQRNVS